MRGKTRKLNWKVLIISIVIVFAVGFLGSIFTSSSVNSSWYQSVKPSITPPNFVFPIVWNVLFLLIALSIYFSWTHVKNKEERVELGLAFGVNLVLNFLWSVVFFGLQNPKLAFFELCILWISIAEMLEVTWRINRKSFWLLVPYILWVTFAGVLNWLIAF